MRAAILFLIACSTPPSLALQLHHRPSVRPNHRPSVTLRRPLRPTPRSPTIVGRSQPEFELPEFELPRLLVADITFIFAFSFARALSTILLEPSFEVESWLAPPRVEPVRLSETLMFAGLCSSLWMASGVVSGAFSMAATADPQAATSNAARTCVGCGGLYLLGGLIGALAIGACSGALCAEASPLYGLAPTLAADQLEGLLGLGLVLILWRRTYADLFLGL